MKMPSILSTKYEVQLSSLLVVVAKKSIRDDVLRKIVTEQTRTSIVQMSVLIIFSYIVNKHFPKTCGS